MRALYLVLSVLISLPTSTFADEHCKKILTGTYYAAPYSEPIGIHAAAIHLLSDDPMNGKPSYHVEKRGDRLVHIGAITGKIFETEEGYNFVGDDNLFNKIAGNGTTACGYMIVSNAITDSDKRRVLYVDLKKANTEKVKEIYDYLMEIWTLVGDDAESRFITKVPTRKMTLEAFTNTTHFMYQEFRDGIAGFALLVPLEKEFLLGGIVTSLSPAAHAGETITYDQNGDYPIKGSPWTSDFSKSLYPNAPTDNTVTVNGGDRVDTVYGGADHQNGKAKDALAARNTVTINKGVVRYSVYGGVASASGSSKATVSDNTITMNAGAEGAYAGEAHTESGTATATGNAVVMNVGTTPTLMGGVAMTTGDGNTIANNNTVIMKDGITEVVYGGSARSNGENTAMATGNTVTITGGSVTEAIIGGGASNDEGGKMVMATNNTVILEGKLVFRQEYTVIRGGSGPNAFTGNALVIKNPMDSAVKAIGNFETMSLTISNKTPAITTTELKLGDGKRKTTISRIDIVDTEKLLAVGDSVVLIRATKIINPELVSAESVGSQGKAVDYTFKIHTTPDSIVAEVATVTPKQ